MDHNPTARSEGRTPVGRGRIRSAPVRLLAVLSLLAGALALIAVVGAVVPTRADASSCALPRPQDLGEIEAVFLAEVESKVLLETRNELGAPADVYEYGIGVFEVLHGAVPDGVKIELSEQNGINLGTTLGVGRVYGFAVYEFDGKVATPTLCGVLSEAFARNLTGADPAPCTITGTAGNDVLTGTPGRDVICGFGGDDVLNGGGGPDILRGGAGDDILRGGPGADVMRGDAGRDRLLGGAGADQLYGGADRDRLLGQRGTDTLRGGPAVDRLVGAGNDLLLGGGSLDWINGVREQPANLG
jgi:hypothetical protein